MDAVYEVLAARYIRRQAKQLAKQLPGIRQAEDIEYIHRARVASRRLRAALRVFGDCLGNRRLRRWRKRLRRLARQLSNARDADVQIEFLCGFLSQPLETAAVRGLSRLLARLERRRERMQSRVVRAVKSLRRSGVLDDMLSRTKKVLDRANDADHINAASAAAARLAFHTRACLDQFLALQDSLQEPEDAERLHSLRISVKRLRYTLEIARSAYPADLLAFIEAAKSLQTLLGEIHDCDVWQAELDGFQATEQERMLRVYGSDRPMVQVEPGIELLRQDRSRRRQQLVEEATAFWRELQRQGTWEKLLKLLEEPIATETAGSGDTEPFAASDVAPPVAGVQVLPPMVCDSADQTAQNAAKAGPDGGREVRSEATLTNEAAAADACATESLRPHVRRKRVVAVPRAN